VVTIGEESVGKTSITTRLVSDSFNPYEPGTIGANFHQYTDVICGKPVEIQIWDTAGQEKFKSICPLYFRNAVAAVCVFSLNNKPSFLQLKQWIEDFLEITGGKPLIYIAANKCDMETEYQLDLSEARDWAEAQRYPLYVTSAKTGDGIRDLFHDLAQSLTEGREFAGDPRMKVDGESYSPCC
jgi:small GTP-binding protein